MIVDCSYAGTVAALDVRRAHTVSIQCEAVSGNPTSAVIEVRRAFSDRPDTPAVVFDSAQTLVLDGSEITTIDTLDTGFFHFVVTTAQSGVKVNIVHRLEGDINADVFQVDVDMSAEGYRGVIATGAAERGCIVADASGSVGAGAMSFERSVSESSLPVAFDHGASVTLDGSTVLDLHLNDAPFIRPRVTTAVASLKARVFGYMRHRYDRHETARYSLSTTTGSFTTTPQTLPFDRNDRSSPWVSNSSGEFLLSPGRYLVTVDVTTDETGGNNRTEFGIIAQSDETGSWVDVPGTERRNYSRNNAQGGQSASMSFMYHALGASSIRIQSWRISGSNTGEWVGDGSSIIIVKV